MAIRYLSGINVDSNTLFVDDSNNRVGIGTASPTTTLDVVSSANTNVDIAHFANSNQVAKIKLSLDGVGSSLISMLDAGNNEDVRLSAQGSSWFNGGNVGIGTASPSDILAINSSSTETILHLTNTSTGTTISDGLRMGLVGASAYFLLRENANMLFSTNNTERMRINNAGNVGIGTTSPGGILDIQQSSSGNTLVKVWNTNTAGTGSSSIRIANSGNNNDGSRLEFSDNNYYVATISGDRTQGLVFRTSATGSSPTGISEWMRITPTGNVGIGTSSPAAKLDVVSAGSTLTNNIKFGDGTKGYLASGSSGVYLSDNNSSSAIMFTHGTRNVGIGTTSPNTKLHLEDSTAFITVRGNDASYSNAAIQLISGNATNNRALGVFHYVENSDVEWFAGLPYSGNDAYVINRNTGYTVPSSQSSPPGIGASGTRLFTINSSGNVGIGTTSPADKLDVAGNISIGTSYKIYTGSASNSAGLDFGGSYFKASGYNGIIFYSSAAGVGSQSERMRITNAGSVGIGTTSPSQKLDVDGNIQILDTDASDGSVFGYLNFHSTSGGSSGNHARIAAIRDSNAEGQMAFYTKVGGGTTEKMRIDADGNVGIGTTSPNHLLDVEAAGASARIYNLTSDGNTDFYLSTVGTIGLSRLLFGDTANNAIGKIIYRNNGDSMAFETNASEAMRITSAGNVGIGTTSPSFKLHVEGTVRSKAPTSSDWALIAYNNLDTAPSGVWFDSGDGELLLRNSSNVLNVRIRSNNSSYFNGGNVGIGTTSPASDLHIADSYPRITLQDTDSTNTLSYIDHNGSDLSFISRNGTSYGNIGFKRYNGTTTQTSMYINSSGDVGIGTTSPSEKLTISGNLWTGTVKQNTSTILQRVNSSWTNNVTTDILYNGWTGSTGDYIVLRGAGNNATQAAFVAAKNGAYFGTHATTGAITDSSTAPLSTTWARIAATSFFNGNVGIGTTSPSYALDIAGSAPTLRVDSTGHAGIMIDRGSTAYDANLMFLTAGATKFRLWMDAADALGIRDESTATEMVTFKAGGSVGIGTTSPTSSKLNVNSNGSSDSVIRIDGANARGASRYALQIVDSDTNGRGSVYVSTTSGPSAMFIGGNVGIGTTSPAASLHIEKTGDQVSSVKGMVLSSGAAGTNKFLPSITWSYGASGTPDFARLEVQRGGGLSGRMLFSVANSSGTMTEAMRIDDAARLGIGTTTPTTRLDLGAGNGAANGLSFGSSSTGVHRSSDGTTLDMGHWANVAVIIDTDNNDSSRHFSVMANSNDSTTATTLMRVLETGNVGIGTTSPYGRLHVYDSATGAAGMTVQNSTEATGNSAAVWFKVAGSTADYRKGAVLFVNDGTGYGRGDFYFASNTSTVSTNIASTADAKMVIKGATGNVGIGTTSPSYKLDVNGSFKGGGFIADDSTFTLTFNSVNVLYGNLSYGALPAASTFGTGDSGIVSDFPGSEVMRIASLGRVGINTTSPQANLHLNGSLRVDAPTNFANIAASLNADPGNGIIGNDPDGLGNDQNILGTPDTWLAVNINGTDYAIPAYAP